MRMKHVKIFPSLIAADPLHLAHVISMLEPYCDGFHLDIMDNHFVPNLTWGPLVINAISAYTKKTLFVHIMADYPEKIIKNLMLRPGDIVAFHSESKNDFLLINNIIKEKKAMSSLAISPKIALSEIFPWLKDVDQVLLMSVQPGFSGQHFLEHSIERLKSLVAYKKAHELSFVMGMDGGINENNIQELEHEGCEIFAIASAIFSKDDTRSALKNLYARAQCI